MRARRFSVAALLLACTPTAPPRPDAAKIAEPAPPPAPAPPWAKVAALADGETLALHLQGARAEPIAAARAAGLLDVDLGDAWAPFIFSESDGPGAPVLPNGYRKTFVELASDHLAPDDLYLTGATRPIDLSPQAVERRRLEDEARRRGEPPPPPPPPKPRPPTPVRNHLEVFGIPPTLSVLLTRLEEDAARTCYADIDREGLAGFDGLITFHTQKDARREQDQRTADAAWAAKILAADAGPPDAKTAARLARHQRGLVQARAVSALQARLVCEGLLTPKVRHTPGLFDLPTHAALAAWERKNDIYGWGFLGGETLTALLRPPLDLHFDTFRRILTERMADAAAILEDGSAEGASYDDGGPHPVPNLIAAHVDALLAQLGVATAADMAAFLRGRADLGRLHVAFAPPALPPYYGPKMDLEVEIDRGDIFYELPFDDAGKPLEQRREHFPHLTVFVRWNKQRVPLARWRTTIGSWRSEVGTDGKVYWKYKNSDVGPRIWKHIVAAPVWIPPDATPGIDLLTRKEFDRNVGPVRVVNTDVIGPGYQSAYGLVMAIHHRVEPGGGLFDNQIRTHGSVDYTSIARRFSHGCHRVVNTRAVRLFGFVLRHRAYDRRGDAALRIKKTFAVDDQPYGYELSTRGYYYELRTPLPVNVLEGRIMGKLAAPITSLVRKPGVDYGTIEDDQGQGQVQVETGSLP